ncbi:hypothetical protein Pcinc_011361 [Petrolisthes cinctipes]|uniref:BZIP domain-containing protein n=1 Tax=Petrolisthes cinctipes TaxID=88211 RepID=A0AAE1KWE8_PETCI|nr:hypothetical protein Pcinc_011361 [Petrolisthes cinctipes]
MDEILLPSPPSSLELEEPYNIALEPTDNHEFDFDLDIEVNGYDDLDVLCSSMLENFDDLQEVEQLETMAPSQLLNQPLTRKRGRKPKIKTDKPRHRKTKVYEMAPFDDKELERRRMNALNAKQHRNRWKQRESEIKLKLEQMRKEVDVLKEMRSRHRISRTVKLWTTQVSEGKGSDVLYIYTHSICSSICNDVLYIYTLQYMQQYQLGNFET